MRAQADAPPIARRCRDILQPFTSSNCASGINACILPGKLRNEVAGGKPDHSA